MPETPDNAELGRDSGGATPAQPGTGDFNLRPTRDLAAAEDPNQVQTLGLDSSPAANGPGEARKFGRYLLLEELTGGMGIVYKATDTLLNRTVALKVLRAGSLAGRQDVLRFLSEAKVGARLEHPAIVPVWEVGELDGALFFTMPFFTQGSLASHLAEFSADCRLAGRLMEKIARAVQHMHDHGVLHRDLKPGNILLNDAGEPLIADFGLAKLPDRSVELTAPGQLLGTIPYMAPEQLDSAEPQACQATDIWALGILLYQLSSGNRPFNAKTESELIKEIRSGEPRPLVLAGGRRDRVLAAVIRRCLAKSPAGRYGSAAALADDLAAWLSGSPTSARPEGLARRGLRFVRRHAIAAWTLVLAILGVSAGWLALQRLDPDRALRQIEEEVRQGSAVLIGETGSPRWSRWLVGGEAAQTSLHHDGSFSIYSWTVSLLELLPDPQHERFAFSADVRHDKKGAIGAVGLYVVHEAENVGDDPVHGFCRLVFDDVMNSEDPNVDRKLTQAWLNPLRFEGQLYCELHRPAACAMTFSGVKPRVFAPAGYAGGVWRTIEVRVGPDELEIFWEGKSHGKLARAEIVSAARGLLAELDPNNLSAPQLKDLKPRFPARGSIGLFVYNSSVSFCNVKVKALEP